MLCRVATALSKKARKSSGNRLPSDHFVAKVRDMTIQAKGTVAVIFIAQRTGEDEDGYRAAAQAMDRLAAHQPGYRGMESVRNDGGLGITVSFWSDDIAAKAWRDHPEHAAIRDAGRDRWYSHYDLHVAEVTRSYDWVKPT
jgi:heme-degrading monooxygenase HmoA